MQIPAVYSVQMVDGNIKLLERLHAIVESLTRSALFTSTFSSELSSDKGIWHCPACKSCVCGAQVQSNRLQTQVHL